MRFLRLGTVVGACVVLSMDSPHPIPQAPVAFASENIRALIEQKERELRDISEFRFSHLEGVVKDRDDEIAKLRERLSRIQADYNYNLQLFQERDAELDRLEEQLAQAADADIRLRSEADSLRAQLSSAVARLEGASARAADLESFYGSELSRVKDAVEAARTARDDDLRRWREQLEAARADADAAITRRDEEVAAVRRHLSEAGEAAVDAVRREGARREEELSAALRKAEVRANDTARALDEVKMQCVSLTGRIETAAAAQAAAEAEASAARSSLERYRGEASSQVAALTRERDMAVAAKASLLSEHETRLGSMVDSLRSVEAEFKSQRDRYEAQLSAQAAAASQAAAEMSEALEGRLHGLAGRLRESESNAARLAGALAESQVSLDGAAARITSLEDTLARRDADLRKVQEEAGEASSRLTAQVENLQSRCNELQQHADDAAAEAARCRAESAACRSRAEEAEAMVRETSEAWERRWAAAGVDHAAQVAAERDHLRQQVADLLQQQQRNMMMQSKTAPATASSSSSVTGSNIHNNDATDLASSSSPSASASALLSQLAGLEGEREAARAEAAALHAALGQARAQAASAGARLAEVSSQAASLHAENEQLRAHTAGLSQRLQHSVTEEEAASLRQRCAGLEEQCGMYRQVVSDMRRAMEDMTAPQQHRAGAGGAASAPGSSDVVVGVGGGDGGHPSSSALADALAYRASAEVMLASLAADRDGLLQETERQGQYIRLLQERMATMESSAARGSGSFGGDHAEVVLLRSHLTALSETVSSLRSQCRRAQTDVARLTGELTFERSGDAVAGDADGDAGGGRKSMTDATNGQAPDSSRTAVVEEEVARLRSDRDRLLELSNGLRAQLHKAQAAAQQQQLRQQQHQAMIAHEIPLPPSASWSPPQGAVLVPAARLTHLETSLARVTQQNAALHTDLQRLIAARTTELRDARQPAASSDTAGDSHHRRERSSPGQPASPPASPGRVRLEAARRRLGLPNAAPGMQNGDITVEYHTRRRNDDAGSDISGYPAEAYEQHGGAGDGSQDEADREAGPNARQPYQAYRHQPPNASLSAAQNPWGSKQPGSSGGGSRSGQGSSVAVTGSSLSINRRYASTATGPGHGPGTSASSSPSRPGVTRRVATMAPSLPAAPPLPPSSAASATGSNDVGDGPVTGIAAVARSKARAMPTAVQSRLRNYAPMAAQHAGHL